MSLILLVDDDPDHRELVQYCLRGQSGGHRIEQLSNGEELFTYLERLGDGEQPRLILMDLRMPGSDGTEVTRRLRQHHRWGGLPVVLLSTSDAPGDMSMAYASGVNSYLVKPMDLGDLYRMLQSAVTYWIHFNRLPGL